MKRLFEDPETLPELREDLQRSMAAGKRYDAASQLPQVLDAMGKASSATPGGAATAVSSIPGAAKLAAVVAVAAGGLALAVATIGGSQGPASDRHQSGAPQRSAGTVQTRASVATERAPRLTEEEASPARLAGPSSSEARREIALIVRIRRVLAEDPAAAYRLALRAEKEFPDGVLAEEREALFIQALAALGKKEEAASRAKAFYEQHATSPLRGAVEQSTRE